MKTQISLNQEVSNLLNATDQEYLEPVEVTSNQELIGPWNLSLNKPPSKFIQLDAAPKPPSIKLKSPSKQQEKKNRVLSMHDTIKVKRLDISGMSYKLPSAKGTEDLVREFRDQKMKTHVSERESQARLLSADVRREINVNKKYLKNHNNLFFRPNLLEIEIPQPSSACLPAQTLTSPKDQVSFSNQSASGNHLRPLSKLSKKGIFYTDLVSPTLTHSEPVQKAKINLLESFIITKQDSDRDKEAQGRDKPSILRRKKSLRETVSLLKKSGFSQYNINCQNFFSEKPQLVLHRKGYLVNRVQTSYRSFNAGTAKVKADQAAEKRAAGIIFREQRNSTEKRTKNLKLDNFF